MSRRDQQDTTGGEPGTARRSLRDRLDAQRRARTVDLPVPDTDLWVRYGTVTPAQVEAASKRRRATAGLSTGEQQSIDVLVTACQGVWETDGDGGRSPLPEFPGVLVPGEDSRLVLTGDLPTFSSPELADELGTEHRAADVVLALYGSGWAVLDAAAAVLSHSGADDSSLLEQARGN